MNDVRRQGAARVPRLPAAMHPNARPAAEAANCANAQGKFWEYHEKLFANQTRARRRQAEGATRARSGLDTREVRRVPRARSRSRRPSTRTSPTAPKVGVNGTPAFFINGRMLSRRAAVREVQGGDRRGAAEQRAAQGELTSPRGGAVTQMCHRTASSFSVRAPILTVRTHVEPAAAQPPRTAGERFHRDRDRDRGAGGVGLGDRGAPGRLARAAADAAARRRGVDPARRGAVAPRTTQSDAARPRRRGDRRDARRRARVCRPCDRP